MSATAKRTTQTACSAQARMVMTERLPPTVQRTIDSSTKRITSMSYDSYGNGARRDSLKNESTSITLPAIRQQTAAARASERSPCCTMQKQRIAIGPISSHAPPKVYEHTATYSNSSSRTISMAVDGACVSKPPERIRCSAKREKDDAQTWTRKHPMDMITCSRFMK